MTRGRRPSVLAVAVSLAAATLFGASTFGASTSEAAPTATTGANAATGAAATSGPCAGGAGVTVVVDFHELGGGVETRCAPGQPASGLDALARAGIAFDTTVRFPGFVCRIAGRPAQDRCIDTSPTSAYWSYWVADRGGSWCYSTTGAAGRRPPEGTVEGWSFSMDRPSNQPPAPRTSPPPAVAGGGRLPAGECDTSITPPAGATPVAPPPAQQPPPSPTPPRPVAPPPTDAAPPGPPGAAPPRGGPPTAPDGSDPATGDDGASDSAGDEPSAADPTGRPGDAGTDGATTDSPTTDGAGDGPSADAEVRGTQVGAAESTDRPTDEELAGAVGPGGGASVGGGAAGPVGALAGLVLIGGLAGGAVYRSRRRDRAPR